MPKAYLTFAEREKAEFIKQRDRQIKAIQGELATTKYKTPIREIEGKVNFSRAVICKVLNTPALATLEQLFEVAYATGKKVNITIE